MKDLFLRFCNPKITFKDIINIEEKMSINLPENYKNHLLKYNGGRPDNGSYSMEELPYGNTENESIDMFYGIVNDKYQSLEDNIYLFNDRIPNELIPIGEDGSGNRICLGIAGERYNKVYFWDHEEEMDGEETEPWYDNIYLIANSFEEFINKLHYLDVNVNSDNNLIITRVYDHYALPTSHYIKHYKPGVIVDFFKQAPAECDEFKIIEHEESKDLELIFEDKEQGIRKKRLLKTDSSYTDAAEKI